MLPAGDVREHPPDNSSSSARSARKSPDAAEARGPSPPSPSASPLPVPTTDLSRSTSTSSAPRHSPTSLPASGSATTWPSAAASTTTSGSPTTASAGPAGGSSPGSSSCSAHAPAPPDVQAAAGPQPASLPVIRPVRIGGQCCGAVLTVASTGTSVTRIRSLLPRVLGHTNLWASAAQPSIWTAVETGMSPPALRSCPAPATYRKWARPGCSPA